MQHFHGDFFSATSAFPLHQQQLDRSTSGMGWVRLSAACGVGSWCCWHWHIEERLLSFSTNGWQNSEGFWSAAQSCWRPAASMYYLACSLMTWVEGQSAPSASLLMVGSWEEWLPHQKALLPFRDLDRLRTGWEELHEVQKIIAGSCTSLFWRLLHSQSFTEHGTISFFYCILSITFHVNAWSIRVSGTRGSWMTFTWCKIESVIQTSYELLHFCPLICSYQKTCTSCTDHQKIGLVNRLHNLREKSCESSPLLAQWRYTHVVPSYRDTCTGKIKYFISFIIRRYFIL